MKLCTVVGTRPQFIKMAPLSKAMSKIFKEIIIHTGQHYDKEMSSNFFEGLDIPKPNYNLNVGSLTHGKQTGIMIQRLEDILLSEKPDFVLVYGDTNSTLAGALAAAKLNICVAHVEAGLRSFNREMPEEINRILTDHCSNLLFVPTKTAILNLANEGITKNVFNTGDVMYDSILMNLDISASKSKLLDELDLNIKDYFYLTVHRPSNTDKRNNLENIVDAIIEMDSNVLFPVHPRTKKSLIKFDLLEKLQSSSNVYLTKPVNYLDSIFSIKNASMVLTDSGGIQKESYILGTPCLTLREETEWIETVDDGWNILTGSNKEKILSHARNFKPSNKRKNYYGTGNSSQKIVDIISKYKF